MISENAFHLYQRNPSSTRPPRKYQRLEIGKDIIYLKGCSTFVKALINSFLGGI